MLNLVTAVIALSLMTASVAGAKSLPDQAGPTPGPSSSSSSVEGDITNPSGLGSAAGAQKAPDATPEDEKKTRCADVSGSTNDEQKRDCVR